MNKKRWAALGIAAFLFVASLIVNLFSTFAFGDVSDWFTDSTLSKKTLEDGDMFNRIAVLEINGPIEDTGTPGSIFAVGGYNHRSFMEQMNQVKNDDTVKAVIIKVNSPGGGVVETAEVHDKIKEIQEEAGKPVYISMGTMATSGGYYISAPAHKIFAAPDTLTGSLGVIIQGFNFSGLAEKFGVEVVTFKSGPYKDILSSLRDMTEEEKKIIEQLIENAHNQFVKVISEGRGLPEDEVRKMADGRIYDGRQALELRLIDGHGYFEDVLETVKEEQKLKNPMVFTYSQGYGWENLFYYGTQKLMKDDFDMEVRALIQTLQEKHAPRLMYLYSE